MNIFVANISFKSSENDLRDLFAEFGEVESCRIMTDKKTGKSRGFGFVRMAQDQEGKVAIQELDGFNFMSRNLVVRKATPNHNKGR